MNTDSESQNNNTLFGGRLVTVRYGDNHTEDIRVRQLPVADYESAYKLLNDEIGLTALICGRKKEWLTAREESAAISPESYEALYLAAKEVNGQGFFVWSVRQAELDRVAQARMLSSIAHLPPEALNQIVAMGAGNISSTTLRTSPRPRA